MSHSNKRAKLYICVRVGCSGIYTAVPLKCNICNHKYEFLQVPYISCNKYLVCPFYIIYRHACSFTAA
uniref:Uncharacterized protein n=1 Tax=Anguilla anguilla TaxID=7936 RepID=A0A0E9WHZ4_ANGAN